MSKLVSAITLAAVSSFAFASPAFAGDNHKTEMKPATVETASVVTQSNDARVIALRSEAEAEVRGAVARGEFIAVEGPDGRTYYNHIVPVSALPDPELDLRVIDTYDVDYGGTVYTNKVTEVVN